MLNTKIEWADHTINFWWGCTKVSQGCKYCYAESNDARWNAANPHWGPGSSRKLQLATALKQLRAVQPGQRVFVNSMGDTFEDHPEIDAARISLWQAITDRPDVIFMLLTKRPENIMAMVPAAWRDGFPRNVWIGTSVEDQEAANTRIPELLEVPCHVRWLSCEPLLGPVDLRQMSIGINPFDPSGQVREIGPAVRLVQWVIVGGESGTHARPMHPDWARALRDQCAAAQVPFFFKQWGEWLDVGMARFFDQRYSGNNAIAFDPDCTVLRVGKKAAGRLLDGVEHNALPQALAAVYNTPT
jgi:protein gp37